ncbi:MAG: S-methyl-5-thioribose-1-phosphate isomerase [Candidatus Cloacimonetes bacterium]|nr:S-methyl-5-thioribose-1-phosphate isomerase [Candidatus Cloacimonadota bacterium]
MMASQSFLRCIELTASSVRLLDQTQLPSREVWLEITDWRDMIEAICFLRIRGAPALGVAAAAYAWLASLRLTPEDDFKSAISSALDIIAASRPTAVNLHHVVAGCRIIVNSVSSIEKAVAALRRYTIELSNYEIDACRRMGEHGLAHIGAGSHRILTICNTGSLATVGIGTALGVVRTLAAHGAVKVFACETRPLLQGARLTMWELMRDGINCALITDGMAASVMRSEGIDLVLAGADRIACNGDTANKIGTLGLAILARHYGIPFYIVAPRSSIDTALATGEGIVIEQRDGDEVRGFGGCAGAPCGCEVRNPAFDVTPAALISAIITDEGAFVAPYNL